MKNLLIAGGTLVVIAIILVAGINKLNRQSESSIKPVMAPQQETQTGVVPTGDAANTNSTNKQFTVVGGNFSFSPNKIVVNKGDTVIITFKNDEGFHDFVLDEFNVRTKQIKAGSQETVQFVADKTGTFEYYCSVGTHRQMGMKGTLEVL